ncbi:MAG: hypothetical protein IJR71_01785 [Prevotella sp.]|nr:hypothetical protein [Prevotella sp.]
MKKSKRFLNTVLAAVLLVGMSSCMQAQKAQTTAVGIHSHNDYAQKRPFVGAYEARSASIEADIFMIDGQFYVGHDEEDLRPELTLEAMYLDPLMAHFQKNGQRAYPFGEPLQLLVDLKNGAETLAALQEMIEKKGYKQLFDTTKNPTAVSLVITGDEITPDHFADYAPYVLQDGRIDVGDKDPLQKYTEEQLKYVPLVSQEFQNFSQWDGKSEISKEDRALLQGLVDKAHAKGVKIRFWAMPDTEQAWQLCLDLGIDFINTDHPQQVRDWLDGKTK